MKQNEPYKRNRRVEERRIKISQEVTDKVNAAFDKADEDCIPSRDDNTYLERIKRLLETLRNPICIRSPYPTQEELRQAEKDNPGYFATSAFGAIMLHEKIEPLKELPELEYFGSTCNKPWWEKLRPYLKGCKRFKYYRDYI
jgi:hypothetical protein